MAGLYGSVLRDKNHLLHEKLLSRIKHLEVLATATQNRLCSDFPQLKDNISLSFPNLLLAVSRYYNDIIAYRAFHDIQIVHRSKMLAHLIKWVHLNPVIVSNISRNQYKALSHEERKIILSVNYFFISNLIGYFYNNISEAQSDNLEKFIGDTIYYLKTGTYSEKMASLAFKKFL
ncbi:MAG: hypothetical protein AB2793_03110 [Candidatus Thiodiazotropha sp.]